MASPLDSELSRKHSAYAIPRGDELILEASQGPAPEVAQFVHAQLRALVLDARFPCVAARSALKNGTYRFGLYEEMGADATTHGLGHDLRRFVADQDHMSDGFSTFFASFMGPIPASEDQFEAVLWNQLQKLHDLEAPFEAWDAAVSTDPDSPEFRMSLAGRAFYIVGLHAGSSRWARRFAWPTLVFNANFLFKRLHAENLIQKFRKVTRQLDTRLQGSVNPNVLTPDEVTVAREFSGKKAEDDWKCPFHPRVGRDTGGKQD
jgi:hypothetical protein